jgi:hypothetical protein
MPTGRASSFALHGAGCQTQTGGTGLLKQYQRGIDYLEQQVCARIVTILVTIGGCHGLKQTCQSV